MSDTGYIIRLIKQSRQKQVTVGKYTFTVRRPTVQEYLSYRTPDNKIFIPVEDLGKFVSDWSGVTGLDLASSAGGDTVPFNAELFMAWIVDYPDIWTELINGILAAFNSYIAARDDQAKN